jgi:hypothetical protein
MLKYSKKYYARIINYKNIKEIKELNEKPKRVHQRKI